ncbi:TPA: hypothetical protein DCX16_00210 [bacterium]|nr:hypothetical protein [bacterium]
MKKNLRKWQKIVVVLAIMVFTLPALISTAMAQELSRRTQWAGVNPLGLLFKIYAGHYGRYLKNRAADLTIPFFYWHPVDDLVILGGGVKYHIYKDGDGRGVFYGGGATCCHVTWDYEWLEYENYTWKQKTERITVFTFTPQAEVGYRWLFGKHNELTIAPSISLGSTVGKVKSSTGEEATYGSSGFHWGLGLGLAYMF